MAKKRSHKSKEKDKDRSNLSYLIVGIIAIIIIVAISKYAGKEAPPEVIVPPEEVIEITPTPRALDNARQAENVIEGPYDYREAGYVSDKVLSRNPASLISNVACSYSRNAISFTVTNHFDEPFHLFFDQVPTPDNLILINVNGRKLYFMDCEGKNILMPGERVQCTQAGNMFLQEPRETFGDQEINRMQIKIYGASDYITFMCEP